MNELSYFEQRMHLLGITEELNSVKLLKYDSETGKNALKDEPIFRKHERGIKILVYNLQRETIRIEKDGSRMKDDWAIIRLEKPLVKLLANGNVDTIKYLMPKGHGSFPFFPPALVEKFEKKTVIENLYITEGFFKAFKGGMHGLDIVGLPSITHLRNKENGALHSDILTLVRTCKVRRVIWLVDGDCLDLSSKANDPKENVDLYRRPASFFASINSFKQLLDDYEVDKYFMHIDTDAIVQEYKKPRADVKGLDDVMVAIPEKIPEMLEDISSVSKTGFWFVKYNITIGLSKVREYFRINNVNTFYHFHSERGQITKGREFVFNGTRYKFDDVKGECAVVVPGEASNYFRVGDDYYKFILKPNKYKQMERHFDGRLKSTISDDHGKNFIKFVPKYEAFCNVPDHVNYQQVINNCFNVYGPLDHIPDEQECTAEDCPMILGFIQHIFGHNTIHFTHPKTKDKKEIANFELGLDYIQLLYQRPWEKLPILCLVSKENNTGKSTFGKLLKQIFSANCAIVGNQDLAGDFNKHWSTKTVVICDETKIDKQTVIEKVKSLSTADKVMMNAKGKDHIEIDCFIKFIFITNNEENFIYATEEDIRYWVMKVPVIAEENPHLLATMIEEIPAFLSFLNRRRMVTEQLNRMWFHPSLLKTEALKKVIQYSRPTIQKEIILFITDMFMDFGVEQIMMSRNDIHQVIFKGSRYEASYIEKVLKEELRIEQFYRVDASQTDLFGQPVKIYSTTRYTYPRWENRLNVSNVMEMVRVDVSTVGRPYIFKRIDYIKDDGSHPILAEQEYLNAMTGAPVPVHGIQNDMPFG